MSDEQKWREQLKAGDSVIIAGSRDDCVIKVDCVTATQIVVGGNRFNRDTGRKRGAATGWRREHLIEPTPDRLTVIAAREAATYLGNVQWWSMPPEIVMEVATRVRELRAAAAPRDNRRTESA